MTDFAHKHIFLLNSTMKCFICMNQFGTGCLKKKVLGDHARFRAIRGFDMYGSAFKFGICRDLTQRCGANTRCISMCD